MAVQEVKNLSMAVQVLTNLINIPKLVAVEESRTCFGPARAPSKSQHPPDSIHILCVHISMKFAFVVKYDGGKQAATHRRVFRLEFLRMFRVFWKCLVFFDNV